MRRGGAPCLGFRTRTHDHCDDPKGNEVSHDGGEDKSFEEKEKLK